MTTTTSAAMVNTLLFWCSAVVLIILLPVLFEIKKRNAEPTFSSDSASPFSNIQVTVLEEMQEKTELGHDIMKKMAEILSILPSLEP
ncbi:MAG: hypothetical protein QXJ02_00965 [Candidatus Bathyarchaeia archaeon]